MTQGQTSTRAPKGGTTIENVKYEGGQFLPSDNTPKRGKYNARKHIKVNHINRARYYMSQAFKCYDNNDDGAGNYNATMAETHCLIAKYFKQI